MRLTFAVFVLREKYEIALLCPIYKQRNVLFWTFSVAKKKENKWTTSDATAWSCTFMIWRREWRGWCHRCCWVNIYLFSLFMISAAMLFNNFLRHRSANRWDLAYSCSRVRARVLLRLAGHHKLFTSEYDPMLWPDGNTLLLKFDNRNRRKIFHLEWVILREKIKETSTREKQFGWFIVWRRGASDVLSSFDFLM